MTKLMTILLAYDAMEEGKFEKDMQVAVNESIHICNKPLSATM